MTDTSRQRKNAAAFRKAQAQAQADTSQRQIPVSQAGLDGMKAEYENLTKVRRREISGVVQQAREEGDLRENAGYHAAREEQGMMEARIRELDYLIKHSVVTTDAVEDMTTIRVGSTVTLDLDGDEVTYKIVGAVEAQPRQGKISNESPVGGALLGHKVGDEFDIKTPAGTAMRAVVKDVRFG